MSDGKDLNGFTGPKVNDAPVWNGVQYAADPKPAFPAKDVSSQGQSGVTNKMVHSIDATRAFGAGN